MTPLRNQLTLHDLGVRPVLVKVRELDDVYLDLHKRSAAGLTTPEEEARLNRMCSEREAEGDAADAAALRPFGLSQSSLSQAKPAAAIATGETK